MESQTEKTPWLKLISKNDFDKFRSKYTFENADAERIVGQAKVTDALALKVRTGSGLIVLGAKILNKETPEVFAELFSKGVDSI